MAMNKKKTTQEVNFDYPRVFPIKVRKKIKENEPVYHINISAIVRNKVDIISDTKDSKDLQNTSEENNLIEKVTVKKKKSKLEHSVNITNNNSTINNGNLKKNRKMKYLNSIDIRESDCEMATYTSKKKKLKRSESIIKRRKLKGLVKESDYETDKKNAETYLNNYEDFQRDNDLFYNANGESTIMGKLLDIPVYPVRNHSADSSRNCEWSISYRNAQKNNLNDFTSNFVTVKRDSFSPSKRKKKISVTDVEEEENVQQKSSYSDLFTSLNRYQDEQNDKSYSNFDIDAGQYNKTFFINSHKHSKVTSSSRDTSGSKTEIDSSFKNSKLSENDSDNSYINSNFNTKSDQCNEIFVFDSHEDSNVTNSSRDSLKKRRKKKKKKLKVDNLEESNLTGSVLFDRDNADDVNAGFNTNDKIDDTLTSLLRYKEETIDICEHKIEDLSDTNSQSCNNPNSIKRKRKMELAETGSVKKKFGKSDYQVTFENALSSLSKSFKTETDEGNAQKIFSKGSSIEENQKQHNEEFKNYLEENNAEQYIKDELNSSKESSLTNLVTRETEILNEAQRLKKNKKKKKKKNSEENSENCKGAINKLRSCKESNSTNLETREKQILDEEKHLENTKKNSNMEKKKKLKKTMLQESFQNAESVETENVDEGNVQKSVSQDIRYSNVENSENYEGKEMNKHHTIENGTKEYVQNELNSSNKDLNDSFANCTIQVEKVENKNVEEIAIPKTRKKSKHKNLSSSKSHLNIQDKETSLKLIAKVDKRKTNDQIYRELINSFTSDSSDELHTKAKQKKSKAELKMKNKNEIEATQILYKEKHLKNKKKYSNITTESDSGINSNIENHKRIKKKRKSTNEKLRNELESDSDVDRNTIMNSEPTSSNLSLKTRFPRIKIKSVGLQSDSDDACDITSTFQRKKAKSRKLPVDTKETKSTSETLHSELQRDSDVNNDLVPQLSNQNGRLSLRGSKSRKIKEKQSTDKSENIEMKNCSESPLEKLSAYLSCSESDDDSDTPSKSVQKETDWSSDDSHVNTKVSLEEQCSITEDDKDILINLKIQRNFDVCPLHRLLLRPSRPSPQEFAVVAQSNIPVKTGRFSKVEDKKIIANWNRFVEEYNLDIQPQAFFKLPKRLRPEQRILFLRYLAQDLNDRLLHRVFFRFKTIYGKDFLKKGRYTKKEDKMILRMKADSHKPFTEIAHQLNRKSTSICKRYELLTKKPCPVKVTIHMADKLVNCMLKVWKCENIEQLKDLELTPKKWRKLAKRMNDVSVERLKKTWHLVVRPRLFSDIKFLSTVKKTIIERLYQRQEDDLTIVNWTEVAEGLHNLSPEKVYDIFLQLAHYYVPKDVRHNYKETVNLLNKKLSGDFIQYNRRIPKWVYENGHLRTEDD